MEKIVRCHKLPPLPLRLSMLALCAWAVYTISTGLISPSPSLTATFPRKERQQLHSWKINQTLLDTNSSAKFNQPFEKHFSVDSNHGRIKGKLYHKSLGADLNEQNNRFQEHTSSSITISSLLRDHIEKVRTGIRSKGNKLLRRQRWNLTYEPRWERYRNISFINHFQQTNSINTLRHNFLLSKLTGEVLVHEADYKGKVPSLGKVTHPGQKLELRRQSLRAIADRYKAKTYAPNILRNDTFHHEASKLISQYGLSTSSSMNSFVKKRTSIYVDFHQGINQETSHVSPRSTGIRTILLWTSLYEGWDFLPKVPTAFSQCSEIRCEITSDRNHLKDSHAVVFHVRTMSLTDLPPFRLPHQKWIFFSLEPPPQSYFSGFQFMQGMFNWTMTYRGDSDIVIPYGRIIPARRRKAKTDWDSLLKKKTKDVIWMVSHCNTYSKREHYVHQLQKFIDVDILGGCGTAVCLFNQTYKCLEAFSKRYKFFLAFENSICDDYVTEKFFRALKYDIVPVVLGGANYKSIAPPGSYINAADYLSPKALADRLHDVSENSTLYKTYLTWKDDGYIVQDKPSRCALCERLHSSDFNIASTYFNIANWWVENSHCTKWTPK